MKYLDALLDKITMYRLLLYYLLTLLGFALLFGAIGWLTFSPINITIATVVIVAFCYGLNLIFARVWNAPANNESAILTGLILALIITPPASPKQLLFPIAAAGLAIASKYLLAVRHKHIFNPAAIAVVLTALGPQESASWWVGTTALLPIVVAGGLLVVRKIRRFTMVTIFLLSALLSTSLFAVLDQRDMLTSLQATVLHSSLFFLAFVMLTEPWTSPSTHSKRIVYAALVGILFAPSLHIGSFYSTPEIALVAGNIAAFFMSPAVKTKLRLKHRRRYGESTIDFTFVPERRFSYRPGQYVELTLPHTSVDARGVRRYITIASSPTEELLHFGVRFYEPSSTFKRTLQEAGEDLFLSAGQLGGDFVMPKDPHVKLAFIAGGIGVTPFRSMVKYLTDTGDSRSVKLIYGERTVADIAYSEVFEEARHKIGIDTTYVITDPKGATSPYLEPGRIDVELIRTRIPDFAERHFYVSGPQPMVKEIRSMLRELAVPAQNIHVDYFFGYA